MLETSLGGGLSKRRSLGWQESQGHQRVSGGGVMVSLRSPAFADGSSPLPQATGPSLLDRSLRARTEEETGARPGQV